LEEIEAVVEEKYNYWRDTFFKIQASGCTEFEKIILLDCDQMVVRNIDHLFEKPAFTATTCGRCVHEEWRSLSAGLLVLEPSGDLHEKLISLILPAIQIKKEKGLQAGDQDVFNRACPEWRNRTDLYIPEKYNICWGLDF
jgi:alpha-N-acetylglucosamine transferase